MGYLKAHTELGWIGDGTNIDPNGVLTAQAYYKVMLESLGYKCNTTEVVGDFTFEGTIAFAATKGLSKAATATTFTVDNVATATMEALKGTVKGGTTTLAATLVAAGKLDAAKATTAGVYTAATAAVLDTVVASANDKIEVGFDVAVDKAFAENVANYKVVVKGSTTAVEVKSAVLTVDPKFVLLTTAAQTGGTAYTMTVGTTSINFAGMAKVTGAPEVDSITCIDTNTVEVVFTKAMDRASVEDVANYTLDKSATVKSAELWASQDDTRKTVRLTTEGLANSKVYTLKIQNVKSADLVAIKTVSKSFSGITDTKAPTINGTITVSNNQRIIVNFSDASGNGIDQASAENMANWSIKDSSGTDLKIVSLTAKDNVTDDYSKYDAVEVATDIQTSGTKYTVTINNLADDSVAKNVITKALSKTFTGKSADKTAPTVGTCVAISDTAIKVVFADQNRLDNATLTNISNYAFAKDISVTNARILRPTKPDLTLGKTVVLTTTAMDSDIKSYALTITGITDEFGNVIKTFNKSVSYHAEDVTPPYVKTVNWVDLNTVKLTFDDTLDNTTATDAANYSVNDLGTVTKAEISGSDTNLYKVVTLTVPTMAENKKYTVTVNGVKDLVGNATSEAKGYFTSQRDGMDVTRPEIVSTDVVSKDELKVTFDEAVNVTPGSTLTVQYGATWATTVTYTQVGSTLDDETTIVYKSGTPTVTNNNDTTFRISAVAGVTDKANNKFVTDTTDYVTFSGNSSLNDQTEVDSIEQIDPLTIKVVFDEPILFVGAGGNITTTGASSSTVATFAGTVDIDEEGTNDSLSTLTLKVSSPLAYNATYIFNFSANVDDYMSTDAIDTTTTDTALTTTIDDQDGPVIEYVEAVNTKKLQVHYNEALSNAGTYKIYADGATTPISSTTYAYSASIDSDKTIVNITFATGALTAGDVYQIKPNSVARDLNNKSSKTADVEFSFVGSTVTPYDYIKGVTIRDAQRIRIYTTIDLGVSGGTGAVATVVNAKGINIASAAAPTLPGDSSINANDDLSFEQVLLKAPIVDGETYTVTVAGISDAYTFVGNVDEGGVAIDAADVITFSGTDVDDYVVTVVYYDNSGATFTLYVKPSGATPAFDATSTMAGTATDALFAFTNATDTADATLAQVLTASATTGYYTINVYRTNGIADGTILGTDLWTAYKGKINGKIDGAAIYTAKITLP